MDWSRIKTIFILAFLILDVFLLSQFMNKHKTNQFEVKNDVSLEEKLKTDGIEYGELSKDAVQDQYMNANTKVFTEKDVADLKHQKISIEDDSVIHSTLKTPILLNEKKDLTELNTFIKSNVLNGDQYGFWDYDEKAGTITYYQKFKDRLFFMNRSAHLVFYVNEDMEVESYLQTMLETIEPISDKEEVLTALRALEAMYKRGILKPDSRIERAELGYYTLVNMEATQVLTPTWHFVVEHNNEKSSLLVNAFEGQVIQASTSTEKSKME